MEITNHNTLEGEVSLHEDRTPLIKLTGAPTIAVCIPVGSKDVMTVCADPTGQQWVGKQGRIPGLVPIQWALTHMKLVPPLNISMTYFAQWGMLSGEARQIMTAEALKVVRDDGFILYWDDDTLPPRDGVFKLYNYLQQNPKVGIAGGVYTSRTNPPAPLVYKTHGGGPYWGFEAGPDATPEPVFALASGFMMARVSAIKDIVAKNPDIPVWADSQSVEIAQGENGEEVAHKVSWGHDIRFCKLMWEAGYEVHVDGRVLCDHFDIGSQQTFRLPPDSEPFRRARNINKKRYWDQVYGIEGVNTWRTYEEMFTAIAESIDDEDVVELGCGVGILGSKLTAEGRARSWKGYDISEAAVDMAKSRFLDAEVKAVKDLTAEDVENSDVVVATEVVEHLVDEDVQHLLKLVKGSGAHTFIFTVPDNCMPPEEVPEHQRTYTSEQVMDLVEQYMPGWSALVTSGDAKHLLAVVTLNER